MLADIIGIMRRRRDSAGKIEETEFFLQERETVNIILMSFGSSLDDAKRRLSTKICSKIILE